jgi:hypothetical protein
LILERADRWMEKVAERGMERGAERGASKEEAKEEGYEQVLIVNAGGSFYLLEYQYSV